MKEKDIKLWQDKDNVWHCVAYTHNWASDIFKTKHRNKEGALSQMVKSIRADGKDTWLLHQEPLKTYIVDLFISNKSRGKEMVEVLEHYSNGELVSVTEINKRN